jgi:hypothetical protein
MVLVSWLADMKARREQFLRWLADMKARRVQFLRTFGYKGAWKTRVAVLRRIDVSIRAEKKRVIGVMRVNKGSFAIMKKAKWVRNQQMKYHPKPCRITLDKAIDVSPAGMEDPVLGMIDRKTLVLALI